MSFTKLQHSIFIIMSSLIISACSSSVDPQTGQRKDPFEGFNRAMWKVNYEVLDPYVLKPAATGWKNYVPSPVKTGVLNVASNIEEPASFVNRLLEGEGEKAMVHLTRFWINSIFGLGGLIDFASLNNDLKLNDGDREFGHTLGSYGVPTGPYLMLPVYGPATPRQDLGGFVDSAYPVLSMISFPWLATKFVIEGIDQRAQVLDQDSLLKRSQDPYTVFREAYFQRLEFKVNDGDTDQDGKEILSEEELRNID